MAALEAGIAPFVRVPANTPDYIARVLEGGALGIIAPHVRSADEAAAVVRAAKFSPLGERSNASGLPHLHFRSFPAPEAYAALNDATMVIVQFESAAALDRTEEIVAVDGVDMVLVGLNDLLADWGIPGQYDHPRVREAYAADHRGLPQARQALRRRRALHADPTWSPSSCGWARATSRPAPTSRSSSAPAPRGRSRCGRSSSDGGAAGQPAARDRASPAPCRRRTFWRSRRGPWRRRNMICR